MTGRIPELESSSVQHIYRRLGDVGAHLHCDESIVDKDFFREKVGTDGSLVACTELLVDLKAV